MLLGTMFPPPFAGVTLKEEPEQIAAVCAVVTLGTGLTVTVTVKDEPAHPAELTGTTVYTTLTGLEVTLLNASFARAEAVRPLATAAPPAETVVFPRERFVTL